MNVLKKTVIFILVLLTVAASFCGCSSEKNTLIDREKMKKYSKGGGYSFAYILNENDFESLKKDLEAGKTVTKSFEKYTPVTELLVGETYYAVGYTVAETNDKSAVKFKKGSGFYFSDEKAGEIDVSSMSVCKYISIGDKEPVVSGLGDLSENRRSYHYEVSMPEDYNRRVTEICTYVIFTPERDMRLRISYGVNASSTKERFGDGYFTEIFADAYHTKKVDLVDMNVSYLDKESYKGGRYDDADLKSSVDMVLSETYYMVVKGRLRPRFSQTTGETVTLKVVFPLASRVDATLDSASSGSYTEKTYESTDQTIINVDFKLPENVEEEKDFTLILRLVPKYVGDVYADLAFFSSDGISVVGEERVIEKIFNVHRG